MIHDVSYDFYGKRLATCSSDQKVKVWDLDEESHWKKTAEWKAHKGSVWKVEWAHPEFGQVIASCSVDRSICIWEEGEEEGTSSPSPPLLGLRAAARVLIVQVICAAQ